MDILERFKFLSISVGKTKIKTFDRKWRIDKGNRKMMIKENGIDFK